MNKKPKNEPFREGSAGEKRLWLKTTNVCNNRCLFCHDAPQQDGTTAQLDDCVKRIEEGAAGGAERLIVSGGEPTIHPQFLKIVEAGKKAGFGWVQAISNGRMFAYAEFAKKARDAGLREVTVSIHGPDASTHDYLTGIQGSFSQAVTGLKNLLALGLVVSVDIVINAKNLNLLARTIKNFHTLGVREFDLLYITPFGRAFDGERKLLLPLDSQMVAEAISDAISEGERLGCVLWTNRVPPALLEGREEYIQDPKKILDEVRGREEHFQELLDGGVMRCEDPVRCGICFVKDLCADLAADLAAVSKGRVEELFCGPGTVTAEALKVVKKGRLAAVSIFLTVKEPADLKQGKNLAKVSGSGKACVVLTGAPSDEKTARAVLRGFPDAAIFTSSNLYPDFSKVSDEQENGVSPEEAARAAGVLGQCVRGLPLCLNGTRTVGRSVPIDSLIFDGKRLTVDLDRWAGDWIMRRYRVKSLRCAGCKQNKRCGGIGLNHVRAWGFASLDPVKGRKIDSEILKGMGGGK